MRETDKRQSENIGGRLHSAANWTVRIVGSLIFIVLTWYAFRYTQYIEPTGWQELPINVHDSMSNNFLGAAAVIVAFVCLFELERRLSEKTQKIVMRLTLLLSMLWVGCWGFWWISSVERVPVGDQAFIYGGAAYFLDGQYSFLDKGGYCEMFPYQLGLIALTELLFLVTGSTGYYVFQAVCVIFAVGIVYLGYRIVRLITEHVAVAIAYCVLMMGCLPLIFYTGWVYGEIPSLFFTLLTADFLFEYLKKGKIRYLAGMVTAIGMAILIRKHAMIYLIALCLVSVVYAIKKKDRKIIIAAAAAVILPGLMYAGIYKMYEVRSGYECGEGIPMISGIALGMQEHDGKYGWYYDYAKTIYYANDCSPEISNEIMKQDVKDRMKEFLGNPSYALFFLKEKILSQWNEPLYEALYFNNQYAKSCYIPAATTFVSKISNGYFLRVLGICDRLQFVIYLGVTCYFLFAVRKRSNILHHLLAVAMIGGFFFSIIWEAKARYILPYYVTMFPCAVIGYEQMLRQVMTLIRRVMGSNQAEESEEISEAA